jgi:hypothetical protein
VGRSEINSSEFIDRLDLSQVGDLSVVKDISAEKYCELCDYLDYHPEDFALCTHSCVGSGNREALKSVISDISGNFEDENNLNSMVDSYKKLVERMEKSKYKLEEIYDLVFRDVAIILDICSDNNLFAPHKSDNSKIDTSDIVKESEFIYIFVYQVMSVHSQFGRGFIDQMKNNRLFSFKLKEEITEIPYYELLKPIVASLSEKTFDKNLYPKL